MQTCYFSFLSFFLSPFSCFLFFFLCSCVQGVRGLYRGFGSTVLREVRLPIHKNTCVFYSHVPVDLFLIWSMFPVLITSSYEDHWTHLFGVSDDRIFPREVLYLRLQISFQSRARIYITQILSLIFALRSP